MKAIKAAYSKFSKYANTIASYLCYLFLSLIVVDVITSVVMRYILQKPMTWAEQLATYCMIWLAFLSSSIALRKAAHMGMDFLVKVLPPNIRRLFEAVAHLLILAFLVVFTYWSFKHSIAVRLQFSPVVFNISMFWFYLSLPVGGIFMLIHEIEVILNGAELDE
jgi:TRAP-type C4-dicarboxylate transport system, small permease component